MNLRTRLAKLERNYGSKPGEPLLPDVDEVLAKIIREEREAKARATLVPPFDGTVGSVANAEPMTATQRHGPAQQPSGEPLLPDVDEVLAKIIREEREAKARATLVHPFAGNVGSVISAERKTAADGHVADLTGDREQYRL